MAVTKKAVGSSKKPKPPSKSGSAKIATAPVTTNKMHTTKIHY